MIRFVLRAQIALKTRESNCPP